MLIDYHVHLIAHGEYECSKERVLEYLNQAQTRGIREIGFAEHEEWAAHVEPEILDSVERDVSGIRIRRGLEIDYSFERETEIRGIINKQDLDFVIGSVHFIDGWGFDHPDFRSGFEGADIDNIYARYFAIVARAITSGLFDIVGHLDLIKIWGHRPKRRQDRDYVEPLLADMKASGLVIEINTAGLRKPVNEMYPSSRLLEMLFAADIPITFGSDAHEPDDVGRDLEIAREIASKAGYRWCVGFERRRRYRLSLV